MPRLAAFYPATSVQILERRGTELASTPLLARPLGGNASNAERKLYHDDRPRLIEALMHHRVLIPEGRSEYEWFRLLADILETGDRVLMATPSDAPPFGAVVGVVPTHDSAVAETFKQVRRVRAGIVPLVDGDDEGDEKVRQLRGMSPSPEVIIQWPDAWAIEDAVGWILKGDESAVLGELKARVDRDFEDIDNLIALFKIKTGAGRLKTDYLAYEEVAAVIGSHELCLGRAERLLEAITLACLGRHAESALIERGDNRSTKDCLILRFSP